MYDIQELEKEAQSDLQWDMSNCDSVCLRIPSLKTKWCSKLFRAEMDAKAVELQLNATYAKLHEAYISGNKINSIVDRRDVNIYITGDADYIKVFAKHELAKQTCKWIDGVLKGIDSMSFSISSAVRWSIFKDGG